jgi:hypothetical protein
MDIVTAPADQFGAACRVTQIESATVATRSAVAKLGELFDHGRDDDLVGVTVLSEDGQATVASVAHAHGGSPMKNERGEQMKERRSLGGARFSTIR